MNTAHEDDGEALVVQERLVAMTDRLSPRANGNSAEESYAESWARLARKKNRRRPT